MNPDTAPQSSPPPKSPPSVCLSAYARTIHSLQTQMGQLLPQEQNHQETQEPQDQRLRRSSETLVRSQRRRDNHRNLKPGATCEYHHGTERRRSVLLLTILALASRPGFASLFYGWPGYDYPAYASASCDARRSQKRRQPAIPPLSGRLAVDEHRQNASNVGTLEAQRTFSLRMRAAALRKSKRSRAGCLAGRHRCPVLFESLCLVGKYSFAFQQSADALQGD